MLKRISHITVLFNLNPPLSFLVSCIPCTPVVPQAGGVAVVRLSGDEAVRIVSHVFRPAGR